MAQDAERQPDGFRLRWTLTHKVVGLVSVLLLLLLVTAGYNYRTLQTIGREIAEVAEIDLPVVRLITGLHAAQLGEHVVLERALRLSTVDVRDEGTDREASVAEFDDHGRRFDAAATRLLTLVTGAAAEIEEYARFADDVRTLQDQHQAFVTSAREALALASAGRNGDAARVVVRAEALARQMEAHISAMASRIESFTTESTLAAEKSETAAKRLSTVLTLVGTGAAAVFSLIFVGGLRRSVGGVTGLATHIADGDLRQPRLPVRTTDEMGQLAVIFNGMLGGLTDNVAQTRAAAESLNAAVTEIAASVREQAASTTEQAAAVQETTATMEEINQSGNQIAERSRQVAAAAEAASTATSQGVDAAQSSTRIMEAIQQQTETVAENIVTLSEKTQAIGEIIASVTDIAEQSNLLALNAAIEAAAAGEQGRRFAVVASEIKNLADQAKEATGKVRTILGDIQRGINTSVMLTEEVVKRVDSGKKQTDVVEKTIKHMADSLTSSVQAFQQITAATGQQQIGFDQVTHAVRNIRQAAEQTAVSTSQMEKAATNLTVLGTQLSRNVERYRV